MTGRPAPRRRGRAGGPVAACRLTACLAAGLAACLAALPGAASACRLALVLALDVSSSVDAAEDRLQREGLAAALLAPEVRAAVFAAPDPVALYAFEWSGRFDQRRLLDWTVLAGPDDLDRAAAALAQTTRGRSDMPTATGFALGHAVRLFDRVPDCAFRTIDLAGDGITNEGFGPALAYRTFPFAGVTVNGLLVDDATAPDRAAIRAHYEEEVLHGPGAFLEIAQGYGDYARAMRRKLVRELSVPVFGRGPVPPTILASQAPGGKGVATGGD